MAASQQMSTADEWIFASLRFENHLEMLKRVRMDFRKYKVVIQNCVLCFVNLCLIFFFCLSFVFQTCVCTWKVWPVLASFLATTTKKNITFMSMSCACTSESMKYFDMNVCVCKRNWRKYFMTSVELITRNEKCALS